MRYRIELTRAARRGLASAPRNIIKRLDTCILKLAEEPYPRGCVKLRGSEDFWRVRVGSYRIIYHVEDELLVIVIVKVGPRKDVYSSSTSSKALKRLPS